MTKFNVIPVPLVVVSSNDPFNPEILLRRYVGRECTHEHKITAEDVEAASGRDIRELIDLYRESPVRALKAHIAPPPDMADQVS